MTEARYPPEIPKRLMGPFVTKYLSMGDGSYAQNDCIFLMHDDHTITIGSNVAIGHWCYLSTKMHKTDNHREHFSGNIIIEDNVWLGNGVIVYPNVRIGENSVIGAHCCIVRDVPPNTKIKVLTQVEEMR